MAQAPDIDVGDRPTEKAAKCLASVEDDLRQASREVHRLMRQVESLREQLQAKRSDHAHMLAVVSHELRTPITVVGGYVRLLLTEEPGPLGDKQRRFLVQAQRACEKLGAFVERVLEAAGAPLYAGALEVCSSPLGPVFAETVGLYREALAARELCLEDDIDPAHVARFDRDAIERVLANLIENAVRFADRRIVVTTRRLRYEGRAFIEVTVADDGPGGREADRERIFAPYVRGEDAGPEGLGLGLALCKGLIGAHRGRIGITANRGGGSRFSFTLPAEG